MTSDQAERPEIALLDHATRTVHRAAIGEDKHMHTDCGLNLADATIGPRRTVELVVAGSTDCAECFPERSES